MDQKRRCERHVADVHYYQLGQSLFVDLLFPVSMIQNLLNVSCTSYTNPQHAPVLDVLCRRKETSIMSSFIAAASRGTPCHTKIRDTVRTTASSLSRAHLIKSSNSTSLMDRRALRLSKLTTKLLRNLFRNKTDYSVILPTTHRIRTCNKWNLFHCDN